MCGSEGVGGMAEKNPAARQAREYGVDYTPSPGAGAAGEKTDVAKPSFMEGLIKGFTKQIGSLIPGAGIFVDEALNPGSGTASKVVGAVNDLLGYDPGDPANAAAYDKYVSETEANRGARGEGRGVLGNINNTSQNPILTPTPTNPTVNNQQEEIDLTGTNGQKEDLATLLALRGIRGKGLKSYRT